jgi:hypothetical protein
VLTQPCVDGVQCTSAVESEARRRRALGTDLRLPVAFTMPGPAWQVGYPNAAAEVAGLRRVRTLAEAEPAASPRGR